jgi:aquaporin Z
MDATMELRRKLAVEFIGTFFLVFTVGMASRTAGSFAPLAIGAVLMVMVFAGGHVSGGHYNPAVSTAVLLRGKMPRADYLPYVATQVLAAIAAALVVIVLGYDPASSIPTAGIGSMLVVEFLFTFALAYVVLNVATAKGTEGNSFYGLAIGFTLATGIFAVGSISGGAFNPAVAVGATVMGVFSWSHIWIYIVANALGGAAAAEVFRLVEPVEETASEILRADPNLRVRSTGREAA